MPQTVEQLGFATVALALAMIGVVLLQRRWPQDEHTDTIVLLWHWAQRRSKSNEVAVKPKAKPAKRKPEKAKGAAKAKPAAKKKAPSPKDETRRGTRKKTDPVPEEVKHVADEPRRRRFRRRNEDPVEAEDATPALEEPIEEVAPTPERPRERPHVSVPRIADDADHVSLSPARDPSERHGEPKILLRQRFRRGLKRTRDRLGSEMREAFTGGATPEAFDRLEEALVAADVGVATTTALVDDLRQRIGLSDVTLSRTIKEVMTSQLEASDRRLHLVRGRLTVWVVVGVNGTGKTTTIAKLAQRAKDLGLPVSLAAADTFRAAAVEQLTEWGRRLDVEVIKQKQGADPGAVVFDAVARAKANGSRLLIVDTAGRLHTRKPLMDELQKVFRVIEREEEAVIAETLLVIDATTGQNGIAQAKAFKDVVAVTGLVIAKLDGTAKGGIAFAVERELGVPVKAVGVGEGAKDLVPFDPAVFVDALVGEDD